MIQAKTQAKIALGYFLVAVVLGLILRISGILNLGIDYRFFLHTHSHIALLGWVYLGLTAILYKVFLAEKTISIKYKRIYYATQISLIGMLVAFPIQGYALFSIAFSTLFLFASYFFTHLFLKFTKGESIPGLNIIRTSLFYLVFSSIGPWALGGIMNTLGNTSQWYKIAIYFYLHFLYNGWFVATILGLLILWLSSLGFDFKLIVLKRISWLLHSSIILTFFLSVLFVSPPLPYYILGAIGAILQIGLGVVVLGQFNKSKSIIRQYSTKFDILLLRLLAIFVIVKIILQLISALPSISMLAFQTLDFVIAYLHFVFLGFITLSLLLFYKYFLKIVVAPFATVLYLIGFFLTEILIILKGMNLWNKFTFTESHNLALVLASALIVISIAMMTFLTRKHVS